MVNTLAKAMGGEFLTRDVVIAASIESSGMIETSGKKAVIFNSEQTKILKDNVNNGAYWGNVNDVIEVYSTAASFKNRVPVDLDQ